MSQPLFSALFDETERRPMTVSELTNAVRASLEARFAAVWVEGEISNFKAHSSGHWYFTIKDKNAQLRAKCFRSSNQRIRFRPTDGLHIRAKGKLTVFAPRGEYELVVESLDPVGAGALRIAFEQLRDRLQAEGLFAKELKRPLPVFPRRVGIVTSPTGAAIRDILNVISRRTRTVHVLFSPALVQGDDAGPDIARAIRLINKHHLRALRDGRQSDLVDVLIVGRGGGSSEDLWAFNQEEVARAIRNSTIPVISAVGHETDFTIADFVADVRAATPSAAAEMVATREDQISSALENLGRQLARLTRFRIVEARSRVLEHALSQAFDEVQTRLRDAHLRANSAAHQLQILVDQQLRVAQQRANFFTQALVPAQLRTRTTNASKALDAIAVRSVAAMEDRLRVARETLALNEASLEALSPLAVLNRGYALAQDAAGKLITDSSQVAQGDKVNVLLKQGKLRTQVEEIVE